MIVGIDFDRVLFDTDRFNEELKEVTELQHVEAEVYDENGNYSPEKHAEAAGADTENIYEFVEKNARKYIYPDVKELAELDHDIWIVTRGEKKFQEAKIQGAGIEKLADKVVVVEEGSKDVGVDFLIDDRVEELEKADLQGYVLDRSKETLKDAIEEVEEDEA